VGHPPLVSGRRGAVRVVAVLRLLAKWIKRDFQIRFTQTVMGSVWAVIQPLALTAGFVFLLRGGGLSKTTVPYGTFVYTGMLLWSLFATGLTQGSLAIAGSMYLSSKARFPRVVAPVSGVMLAMFDFAIGVAALPIFFYIQKVPARFEPLPLLGGLVGCLLFTASLAIFASALIIFIRDIRLGLPLLLQVGLLVTPVAYAGTQRPAFRVLNRWNPLAVYVNGFRSALMKLPGPLLADWGRACTVTLVAGVLAILYFRAVQDRFADVA
jgi:lipopolysaccharide transport system permease protein